MEDLPRFGRLVEFDDEWLKSLVEAEPPRTMDEIAEKFIIFKV